MPRKITSVLELARYRVGDVAWWVTLRYLEDVPEISEDNDWMNNVHPKIFYESGPYRKQWPYKAMLPRLQHSDFTWFVGLLISQFVVEQFNICDIIRSNDTGEFYYSNENNEWMPESYLFDTDIAARRERTRIIKMMRRWVDAH